MKGLAKGRSHLRQIFALSSLVVVLAQVTIAKSSSNNQISELLVRKFPGSNSSGEPLPKILKLTSSGREKVEEPLFTLKSDPVKVQVDFKTVDVNILNKLKDKENAEKVAVIKEDLQSRIKIDEGETTSPEPAEEIIPTEPMDPEEVKRRQAKIKEDIESRLFPDSSFLVAIRREDSPQEEKPHYQVKRSGDDYYAEEPVAEESHQSSVTTLPTKEDSFLSIFESLFGSSDEESQTKKKSKPEDGEPIFKKIDDEKMEENLKIVGDLLKPLKPIEEPESKSTKPYLVYGQDQPELRIVNNYHVGQSQNQGYKSSPGSKNPAYHSSFRPITDKSFQSHKFHSTDGYEDYDLDEFLDRDDATTKGKQTPSIVTPSVVVTTAATPTTPARTTAKNPHENKLLTFPSVQKKNEYFNRNRYQEVRNESTEKWIAKEPERTSFPAVEAKTKTTTTTEKQYSTYYSQKANEVKPPKIYESPNFYNLINLPVKYSTKDTAIPLISSSYANTKIQGSSAHKYEKNSNGKYPNHKYDQINAVVTNRPSYWATKRTEGTTKPTERTTVTYRPSTLMSSTTNKYVPQGEFDKFDYDDMQMGFEGLEFGGYGVKKEAEIKPQTQATLPKATTTAYRETDQTNKNVKPFETKYETLSENQNSKRKETANKETETVSKEVEEQQYEGSEYDSDEKLGPINQPQVNHGSGSQHKNEFEQNKNVNNEYKETINPGAEPEYEYYDYEFESTTATTTKKPTTTTTTTTTTTPKSKISYTDFPKEKIKPQPFDEKVAVVVPSSSHNFYEEVRPATREPPTVIMSSVDAGRTSPATTAMTSTPKPTYTTTPSTTTKSTEAEATIRFKKPANQNYNYNHYANFVAPAFENQEEQGSHTTKSTPLLTTGTPSTVKLTTESTTNRIVEASTNKVRQSGQESNINIVLVPTKEIIRNGEKTEEKYSPEELFLRPAHTFQLKPNGLPYGNNRDYVTEVTVQGHAGNGPFPSLGNRPPLQGHFVASSIVTNPYGDDEPFRPIPKPPGMTSSFQVVNENVQNQHKQNLAPLPNQRPIPALTNPEDKIRESSHEPHKFIPSPQLHRPVQQRPSGYVRPTDLDYDFEGIQTEPKPGQFVIFSKPQLNPELNENQSKKKLESERPKETISNVPHFQNKGSRFPSGNQVVFKPNEEQYHQTGLVQQPEPEGRPIYENSGESDGHELALELVPPRETQTEKPFDRNLIPSESENVENKVTYPRPHWEKNGKPSFLLNPTSNQNDKSRLPSLPSQMTPPSLVQHNGIPPQRYRRPVQPYPTTIRKNYNEGPSNIQPKPNLPNILPQFRPNMKIGGRPYHRPPPGFVNPNRRTSMNRYHEKEHGNFPYHIQYPDKDGSSHREHEQEPEIVPKFITNRGTFPGDSWNNRGMQKRLGESPMNEQSKPDYHLHPPQSFKILRRLQRTPVTTLQMLKQGSKARQTETAKENVGSLLPRHYASLSDRSEIEENLYIVYPAKAPQKVHLENIGNVFIVSDTKSQKTPTFTNGKLFLNTGKKGNPLSEKVKIEFSSGGANPKDEEVKQSNESESTEETSKDSNQEVEETSLEEYKIDSEPISGTKDERIDMNLHLQSNNQWNEVKSTQLYKVPDDGQTESDGFSDRTELKVGAPSQYQTAITDDENSAFTLGTIMLAVPEGNRKGQVAAASLQGADVTLHPPRLSVNERIANGKIVTVSMPLDMKEDGNEKESLPEGQNFEAPFQASLRANESDLHPISQGWTVVKLPEEKVDAGDEEATTLLTTTPFSFENFTPELIGGFKPIFEIPKQPEEPEEPKNVEPEGTPIGGTEEPKSPMAR